MGTPGGTGHMFLPLSGSNMDIPVVKHDNLTCSLDPEFTALLNSVILSKPSGCNWSFHDLVIEKVLETPFSDDCIEKVVGFDHRLVPILASEMALINALSFADSKRLS